MDAKEFSKTRTSLEARLKEAHARLTAALDRLTPQQAYIGTEWSVVDCLNHLAPANGGYGNMVSSLISQEHPVGRAFAPVEQRWAGTKSNLTAEYERCLGALGAMKAERWETQVSLPNGTTRPLGEYLTSMVGHFEDHTGQIIDQIIPRVAPELAAKPAASSKK